MARFTIVVPSGPENAEQLAQQFTAATGFQFHIQPNGTLVATADEESLAEIFGEQAEALQTGGEAVLEDFRVFVSPVGGDGDGIDLAEFGAPVVGEAATIPGDGTLVRIRNPEGSQDPFLFTVVYEFLDVQFAYEIGGPERFRELFPEGEAFFGSVQTVDRRLPEDVLGVGSIDERLGSTDSLQAEIERDLRIQGFEAIPDWLRNDPQAQFIFVQSANEGWTPGRTLRTLSQQSQGFQERFPAFQTVLSEAGGDEVVAMARLVELENDFRDVLRQTRGPQADVSPAYIAGLVETGWLPEQAILILRQEQALQRNPEALQNFNEMLVANGLQPLEEAGFAAAMASFQAGGSPDVDLTEVLGGNDPAAIFDTINDAIALTELEDAGFRDLDLDFVRMLRDETEGVLDEDAVRDFAQRAAAQAFRFLPELERGDFGITRESIIAAAAGETDPEGRSAAEVGSLLARFMRQRQAAATGFEGFGAFLDERGRLRIPGLAAL